MPSTQPNYFRDFIKSATVVAGATVTLINEKWIGMRGQCFALGVGINDPTLWATVTFQVLINGVPVLDYGSIQDRIGSIDLMTPVEIPLPEGCLIQFIVTNGGAAASIFAARLQCKTA
jgi:hypothetical protein